jgi:hypothetical protein
MFEVRVHDLGGHYSGGSRSTRLEMSIERNVERALFPIASAVEVSRGRRIALSTQRGGKAEGRQGFTRDLLAATRRMRVFVIVGLRKDWGSGKRLCEAVTLPWGH